MADPTFALLAELQELRTQLRAVQVKTVALSELLQNALQHSNNARTTRIVKLEEAMEKRTCAREANALSARSCRARQRGEPNAPARLQPGPVAMQKKKTHHHKQQTRRRSRTPTSSSSSASSATSS